MKKEHQLAKNYKFDYTKYRSELISILTEINETEDLSWRKFRKILATYPKDGNKIFSKNHLVLGYQGLLKEGTTDLPESADLMSKIQKKPIRTESGVTTVTVLTKPFPCPGKCIFCPNDVRMPKSYLADEPGAQRAGRNKFDPYLQTYRRLQALENIGHDTSKIELIILGGTWSYYPENYQIWFIKRCFEALNDFGDGIDDTKLTEEKAKVFDYSENDLKAKSVRDTSYNKMISEISRKSDLKLTRTRETCTWEDLFTQHKRNELNKTRCVGLVVETRPDNISEEEVIRIRKLGCTKTQIGFQSLNDEVLELNHRGHDVASTIRAVKLLREAGFKVHAHWMANLYGSNVEKDIEDFTKVFDSDFFKPDELKIYPCSLIETAELMDYYKSGKWKPFTKEELLKVVTETIRLTPEYCRLTRVIRDIPSTDIVVGNKLTNFRQIAELELDRQGIIRKDIRSREIKGKTIIREDLELQIIDYDTSVSQEKFLQFVNKDNKIAGFLRLSFPKNKKHSFISELDDSAIIREIHVYGKVVSIGKTKLGKAQHLGLGKELIEKAKELSKEANYEKLAVISSIGTREYYRKRGFVDGELYQIQIL